MTAKLTKKQKEFMNDFKDQSNMEFFKSEARTVKSLERRGYIKYKDNIAYKLYEPKLILTGIVKYDPSFGYYDLNGLYDAIYKYKDKKIKITIEEI